ncbi:PIS1 [Blepharisma stoltei]|uniref:CDP-diacylglycerol--inositol 3-phosphatidyltransferase n=1 Tax=Blepharisma stoltei TaxID=1481888 RepID=A0AAU9IZ38_9CILI|nr:unnamed protein product [Blepharisma stoltei]
MVHVLLYYANIIDYGRILFLLWAMAVYQSNPLAFIFFYVVSAALDAVDGMAARHFHQTSNVGMVLDMSIDRMAYLVIQAINFILFPQYANVYLTLIILDGVSHIAMVSSSLISGKTTHKLKDEDTHWLLRLYYGTHLLFTLCLCSEGFAVISYITYYYQFEGILGVLHKALFVFFAAGTFVKQVINVFQIQHAAKQYQLFLDSPKKKA